MNDTTPSILVVDDDENVLRSYVRGLTYEAVLYTASSIDAARAIVAEYEIDVAVIDLRIATENGIVLVEELKAELPKLRILLASGFLSTETTVAAMRAGASDVRQKPIFPQALMQWIANGTWDELAESDTPTLERVTWEHVQRVLADCKHNVSEAARRLGIERATVRRHLRKTAPPR